MFKIISELRKLSISELKKEILDLQEGELKNRKEIEFFIKRENELREELHKTQTHLNKKLNSV